jgi:hypothetical protein
LIEAGADRAARNHEGSTPINVGEKASSSVKMLEILSEVGE